MDLLTMSKSYFFLSNNFISSKILKYNVYTLFKILFKISICLFEYVLKFLL